MAILHGMDTVIIDRHNGAGGERSNSWVTACWCWYEHHGIVTVRSDPCALRHSARAPTVRSLRRMNTVQRAGVETMEEGLVRAGVSMTGWQRCAPVRTNQ